MLRASSTNFLPRHAEYQCFHVCALSECEMEPRCPSQGAPWVLVKVSVFSRSSALCVSSSVNCALVSFAHISIGVFFLVDWWVVVDLWNKKMASISRGKKDISQVVSKIQGNTPDIPLPQSLCLRSSCGLEGSSQRRLQGLVSHLLTGHPWGAFTNAS